MTRTQRLRPVVEHNDRKQQLALREFARCQGALDAELDRLEQLKAYRLEYLQSKQAEAGVFTSIELQDFDRFMQQLDYTIERQMELVELRRSELEQKRRAWHLTRVDSKKLHKVVEKLEREEVAEQERKEQKSLDEFAQRKNPRA